MDGHHETHLGWANGQSWKKRSRQFFYIAYNNNCSLELDGYVFDFPLRLIGSLVLTAEG
jgi:hypothetical protein